MLVYKSGAEMLARNLSITFIGSRRFFSFTPRKMVSVPAASATNQNVTLPFIPELYNPNFLDILLPTAQNASVQVPNDTPQPSNPMMDALKATAHQTFTENGAPAYSSTLSATLDAFRGVNAYTEGSEMESLLTAAWNEDPHLTLRLIWNLRSIHDGKSEKEAFYQAFGWLYDHHPRTAILNLHLLVEPVCKRPKTTQFMSHGYWKDLLNILALATADELQMNSPDIRMHSHSSSYHPERKPVNKEIDATTRINLSRARDAVEKAKAKQERLQTTVELHKQLVDKLAQPKFRALYITVARLFSERLIKDIRTMDEIEALPTGSDSFSLSKQLSLAGKWAPTPGASHDRHTNISTAIIQLIYHAHVMKVPSSVSATPDTALVPIDAHILRSFFQRWVLVPLRKALAIPEPLMATRRWSEIRYNRVSSVAMQQHMEQFCKHDPDRFMAYLTDVEDGKKKISGATLMPHELVAHAGSLGRDMGYADGLYEDEDEDMSSNRSEKRSALSEVKKKMAEIKLRVVEAQWKTLIERLRESGKMENAIAICDVSGSMGSIDSVPSKGHVQPILPAVALSLILAQLAAPPFSNGFITFSENPQYVQLDPTKSVAANVISMVRADWGVNTNFDAVFLKLLLPLAIKNNIKQEDMIKRLFVFSDMQFDNSRNSSANPADWETNHDVIEKAFKEAGYEMPEIVYWNLASRNIVTTPVTGERKGVALLSGFSSSMLKAFMGEELEEEEEEEERPQGSEERVPKVKEEFNPISVMKRILGKKSYSGLVVHD